MKQSDFMHPNFGLLESNFDELDDIALMNAVETILTQSSVGTALASEQHQPATTSGPVNPEPIAFDETNNHKRFAPHMPLADFLEQQQNTNTKRKTVNDVKLFQTYLTSQNETRFPQFIPPMALSEYIAGFMLSVRRKDGHEFEPTTLRSFLSSINRHLISNGYKFCIMTDVQFRQCRDVLAAKQKQLKSLGKGNKPMAADEISDQDLELMYQKKVLGPVTPTSLQHTMWMICTLQFGMRTGKETHDLHWGDIQLRADDDGVEYLVYTQERQTKTRTGSNPRDIRKTKPRAYALPECPERDPVALYKQFRSVRPGDMLDPDSPFFLSINHSPKPGHAWYKKMPMGINKLYSIMSDLKAGAGLQVTDKRLTNYSVRKHLVQKLTDEGLPPNQIVQISGHKNINSLNNYSHLKADQTKKISAILSNRPTPPVKNPVPVTHTVTSTTRKSPLISVQSTSQNFSETKLPSTQDQGPSPCYKPPATDPHSTVQSLNPQSFNPSHLAGMFAGNTIHGNININFNQSHSQQMAKNTAFTANVSPRMAINSPIVPKKFKRIRVLDSDSD